MVKKGFPMWINLQIYCFGIWLACNNYEWYEMYDIDPTLHFNENILCFLDEIKSHKDD